MWLAFYCLGRLNNVTSIKWREYGGKGRDKTPQSNTLGFQNRANGTSREGEGKRDCPAFRAWTSPAQYHRTHCNEKVLRGNKALLSPPEQKQGLWMQLYSVWEGLNGTVLSIGRTSPWFRLLLLTSVKFRDESSCFLPKSPHRGHTPSTHTQAYQGSL